MWDSINALAGSTAFLNGFWLFVGIVAGAFVQHSLNALTRRSQAKTALAVLKVEIAYNRENVQRLRNHLRWLRERISSDQVVVDQLFIPMHAFDYSSVAPLISSGYFHVLLGPERFGKYVQFSQYFIVANGQFLTEKLRVEHQAKNSLMFLDELDSRITEVDNGLSEIALARLSRISLRLITPH